MTIRGPIPAAALALALLLAPPAQASWLDDGAGAAITLSPDGVLLVLPEPTLLAARHAGLSTRQAVTEFLERWIQHCSDIADMDQPHAGLRVELSLARLVPGTGWLIADDEGETLTVDYVPARRAVCVTPGEAGPSS